MKAFHCRCAAIRIFRQRSTEGLAMSRLSRTVAVFAVAAVVGTGLTAPPARARHAPLPEPAPDYCGEQCHDILPPGQSGNATFIELIGHLLFGTLPKHSGDQLAAYAELAARYPSLSTDAVAAFFNAHSFGVPADQVDRSYRPREDVTNVRGKPPGAPHITGSTRSGTMLG